MSCHDEGKTNVNLAFSVPRDGWSKINGFDKPGKKCGKYHQIIPFEHLNQISGVTHGDFLGTENGRISGMTVHQVEGLPTGASLGIVAGHKTKDGFCPLESKDTTAHIDMKGDTHVYHSIVSGRTPGSASKVEFVEPKNFAKAEQATAKVERWKDVHSAEKLTAFEATNKKGETKSLATVPTSSALGKLISRNKDNSKFTASTGQIRTIVNNDDEHYVLNKKSADELHTGLNQALAPQSLFGDPEKPFAIRVFTDGEVLEGTGSHPFNGHLSLHRPGAEKILFNEDAEKEVKRAEMEVKLPSGSSMANPEHDQLARAVFADEIGEIVEIKAATENAGGDSQND